MYKHKILFEFKFTAILTLNEPPVNFFLLCADLCFVHAYNIHFEVYQKTFRDFLFSKFILLVTQSKNLKPNAHKYHYLNLCVDL